MCNQELNNSFTSASSQQNTFAFITATLSLTRTVSSKSILIRSLLLTYKCRSISEGPERIFSSVDDRLCTKLGPETSFNCDLQLASLRGSRFGRNEHLSLAVTCPYRIKVQYLFIRRRMPFLRMPTLVAN